MSGLSGLSGLTGTSGITGRGAGAADLALLRDEFKNTFAAGELDGTPATPGPGLRAVTGPWAADGVHDRAVGGIQTGTPVWGGAELIPFGDEVVDPASRPVLVALVTLDDFGSPFALGLVEEAPAGDPDDATVAWRVLDGDLTIVLGGIVHQLAGTSRNIRSSQYLLVIRLSNPGVEVLISPWAADAGHGMTDPIGLPAYPLARRLGGSLVGAEAAEATLIPFLSSLGSPDAAYGGHIVESVRVIDVPEWADQDELADQADRFDRPDSLTAIGNGWISYFATWGLSGGRAYLVSNPGGGWPLAYHPDAPSDANFVWEIEIPAAIGFISPTFRHMDGGGTYLRLTNNGGGANIFLQRFVGGTYNKDLWSQAAAWPTSGTVRVGIVAKGTKLLPVFNDQVLNGGAWIELDAGDANLTGTGQGISIYDDAPSDHFVMVVAAYPHEIELPASIQASGKVPAPWVAAGAPLLDAPGTASDGTRLNAYAPPIGPTAVEVVGVWDIQGDQMGVATPDDSNVSVVTWETGTPDVEIIVTCHLPNPAGYVFAGPLARYAGVETWLWGRLFRNDEDQFNSLEIEALRSLGLGTAAIVKKTNTGTIDEAWADGSAQTIRMQLLGDQIRIAWLDPAGSIWRQRLTLFQPMPMGTRHGLAVVEPDLGTRFRNLIIRPL